MKKDAKKAPAKAAPKPSGNSKSKAPATKPVAKNGKKAAVPPAKVPPAKVSPTKVSPTNVSTKAAPPKGLASSKQSAKADSKPQPKGKVQPPAKAPSLAATNGKATANAVKGAKASAAKAPAAKSPSAPALAEKGAKGAKGSKASGEKPGVPDTPSVPKKGPIDLAQHKSVAEAAAAVANARGGTGEFIIINGRRVRAISTKGISIAKKPRASATEAAEPPSEQQIREIKTKLSKKELDEYKALLHTKRRQLVGMLSGMEDEALRSSGGNLSNMPVHMADMGSDVYEQDFTLGMAETERAIINEIDAALQRIEDKTFGICQMTGKPISKARLDAKPWAKYTIEAERIAESSGPR